MMCVGIAIAPYMPHRSHTCTIVRDENIDLDVLVFTNVLKEQAELAGLSVEEYAETVGQTFAQLNNPARHRAIVNMDGAMALHTTCLPLHAAWW